MAKYKKMTSIAFAIKDLGPNQIAYTCITNLNKWIENNYGVDPVLFFEEIAVPCVEPNCARYHTYNTCQYYGNLIYTDIDTLYNTYKICPAKKIFYIYDIAKNLKDDRFGTLLNDKNIIKIFRTKDYYNKIKSLGFKLDDNIVIDFNIDDIIKVIKNEEARNN